MIATFCDGFNDLCEFSFFSFFWCDETPLKGSVTLETSFAPIQYGLVPRRPSPSTVGSRSGQSQDVVRLENTPNPNRTRTSNLNPHELSWLGAHLLSDRHIKIAPSRTRRNAMIRNRKTLQVHSNYKPGEHEDTPPRPQSANQNDEQQTSYNEKWWVLIYGNITNIFKPS